MTVRQHHHEFGNYIGAIVRLGEEECSQGDGDGRKVGDSGRKGSDDLWL